MCVCVNLMLYHLTLFWHFQNWTPFIFNIWLSSFIHVPHLYHHFRCRRRRLLLSRYCHHIWIWLIHTFACVRPVAVVVVVVTGGLVRRSTGRKKRSYSAQTIYFRIYKYAVWQCHGINRELDFGEKASARIHFGQFVGVVLIFFFDIPSYNLLIIARASALINA